LIPPHCVVDHCFFNSVVAWTRLAISQTWLAAAGGAFEGCGGFLRLLNFESLLEEQVEPESQI